MVNKMPAGEVDSQIYQRDYYLKAFHENLEEYLNTLKSGELGNRFEQVFELADLKNGERVLDIGCGRGELLYFSLLKGAQEAVGIDYSQPALSVAGELTGILPEELKGRLYLFCQNISSLELEREFDCCFLTDIIEHLTNEQLHKLFMEIKQHLSGRGRIIIHTAPNKNWIRFEYPLKRFLSLPSTIIKRLSGRKVFKAHPKMNFLKKILVYLDIFYLRDYYSYSPHMHINEQSPSTLRKLLKSFGFDFKVWCEDGSSNFISIVCKRFWGPDIWAVARKEESNSLRQNMAKIKEKVIFLDRDGVINKDPEEKKYVTSIEEFEFVPGAIEAIRGFLSSGYKVFIISNQQGVGKGIYSRQSLRDITNWMLRQIEKKGMRVSGVFYCTHLTQENCSCRKPKAGLIKKAIEGLEIDLSSAFLIGDTEDDIKTGRAAGCKTMLVLSGKTKKEDVKNWEIKPDYIFDDLKAAGDFIKK